MPPVVVGAAIAKIGVAVAGAVGVTLSIGAASFAIGAATIGAGLAAGNKLLRGMFAVSMPQADSSSSRQATVKTTTAPTKIIYGETLVSGPMVFATTDGASNNNLYYAVALAGHEVASINDVYFDDYNVGTIHSTSGAIEGGVGNLRYGPKPTTGDSTIAWVTKYRGTSTQDVDPWLDSAGGDHWGEYHRGRGIAYIVTKWTINEDSIETWDKYTPSDIKAVVKGKKVYDPRESSHTIDDASTWEWSDNPALCVADYLRDEIYGLGIAHAQIDWDAVETAADGCDVSVSVPGSATEKRFTCNGVLFGTDTHLTNINKILSSMNGSLSYVGGKYIIRAGIYQAPTVTLTEDDLIGAISVKTSAERGARFNTIKGIFIDPAQTYKTVEMPKVQLATAVSRDNGEELEREIALNMTNSSYMAQRIAHKLIQLSEHQTVITFPANLSALQLAAGDRVNVSVSELSWTNKVFRVERWVFSEEGGVNLTLVEDASTTYADPAVSEYSTLSATGVIEDGFRGIPAPSGLTATSGLNNIELNWTNPGESQSFSTIQVFASPNSNWSSAVKIGETNGTQFFHDSSTSADAISEGDVRYYWVRAVGVSDDEVSDREPNLDSSNDIDATLIELYPNRDAISASRAVVDGDDGKWLRLFSSTSGITDNEFVVWSTDYKSPSSFRVVWDSSTDHLKTTITEVASSLLTSYRAWKNSGTLYVEVKLGTVDANGDTIHVRIGPSNNASSTTSSVMELNEGTSGFTQIGSDVDLYDGMQGEVWDDRLMRVMAPAIEGIRIGPPGLPRRAVNSQGRTTIDSVGWTASNYNPSLDTPASATDRPDGWYSTDTTVAVPAYVNGDQDTMTLSASGQVEIVNTAFAIEPNERIKVQWRLKDSVGSGNTATIYLNEQDSTLAQGKIAISDATLTNAESQIADASRRTSSVHTFSGTGWESGSYTFELLGSSAPDFASVSILLDSTTQVEYLSAEKLTNPHMPKRIAAGVSPDIAATLQGYSYAAQVYSWDGTADTAAFTAHTIDGSGSGGTQTAELYVDHGTAWGLQHWYSASALDFLIKSGGTERFKIAASNGLVTIPGGLTVEGTLTTTGLNFGEEVEVTAAGNASVLLDAKDGSENTKVEIHAKSGKAAYLDLGGEDVTDYSARIITDQSGGTGTTFHAKGGLLLEPGVGAVTLQYNEANKLQTSSSGITVSGGVTATTGTFSGTVTSETTTGDATFVAYRNQTTLPSSGDGANLIGAYLFKSSDSSGSPPHYAGIGGFADLYGRMELQFFTERDNWDSDPRVPTLTLDISKNATFAGNVDVEGSAGIYQRNSSGGSIVLDDTDTADASIPMVYLRNTAGQLTLGRANRNASTGMTTSSTDSLTISNAGNATFVGNVDVSGELEVTGAWTLDGISGNGFKSYTYGTLLDIANLNSGGWARAHKILTSDDTGSVAFGVHGGGTTLTKAYWSITGDGNSDIGYNDDHGIFMLKNGDVGFGVQSPTEAIDVSGNGKFSGDITFDGGKQIGLERVSGAENPASAPVGPGWMTVASNANGRYHGEIIVSDSDSGDHGFIRIDWMRSYGDSNFTVFNTGGASNRIRGCRVLSQDGNNIYGVKYLQVYVTVSSPYEVDIYHHHGTDDYSAHTVVTPVIENTKTGYSLHGEQLEDLHTYGFAAEEGIRAGGSVAVGGHITVGDSHTIGNDSGDNLAILSSAGENIVLNSGNSIYLDHDSGSTDSIYLANGGTTYAYFRNSSDDLLIGPSGNNHDIFFQGNDGGSTINMLKLDASAYGDATFSGHAILGGKITVGTTIDGVGAPAAGTGILGATAAYGAILTGQGTTNDVTISNDLGQSALGVPTGTRDVVFSAGVYVNGGTDNSGKADFSVATGGSTGGTIAIAGDEIRVGNTDVNWNAKLSYTGSTALSAWNNALTLSVYGGSTDRQILLKPSDGGTAVSMMTVDPDYVQIGTGSQNISMGGGSSGQLKIAGSGYTGAIALDGTAMHIYHNSSSRSLVLGSNESAGITINGSNQTNFHNTVTLGGGVGTITWGSMAGGTGFGVRSGSGRGLSLGSNGTWDYLVIDTSSNVGIGVSSSIASKLHVKTGGATELTVEGDSSGYINAGLVLKANGTAGYRGLGVFMHDKLAEKEWYAGTPYASADTYIIARKTGVASHNNNVAQTANQLVSVNSNGTLTVHKGTLQVGGTAGSHGRIEAYGASGAYIDLTAATSHSTDYDARFIYSSGFAQITNKTGYLDLHPQTGATYIRHSGSVAFETIPEGVTVRDTSGADAMLRLNDSSNSYLGRVYANATNNRFGMYSYIHGAKFYFRGEDAGGTAHTCFWADPDDETYLYYDGSWKARTQSGGFQINGSLSYNSDRRLKKDITPISGALDAVLSLKGVNYTLIDSDTKHIGFVAQDIQADAPSWLTERVVVEPDRDDETAKRLGAIQDGESVEMLALNYANMVALLTEAVKEQQTQIENLTKRIAELET